MARTRTAPPDQDGEGNSPRQADHDESEDEEDDDGAPETFTREMAEMEASREEQRKSALEAKANKKRGGKRVREAEAAKIAVITSTLTEGLSADVLAQAAVQAAALEHADESKKELKRRERARIAEQNDRHKRFDDIQEEKANKRTRSDNIFLEVLGSSHASTLKPSKTALAFADRLVHGANNNRGRIRRSIFDGQKKSGPPKHFCR